MIYFIVWYVVGLVSSLIIDYQECKIVNSDYEDMRYGKEIYYSGGIRPPAYLMLINALLGFIIAGVLIYSEYSNYQYKQSRKED